MTIFYLRKHFSGKDFMKVAECLSKADSDTLRRVQYVSYKNPIATLVLNLTMGLGIGSFYVGKTAFGVLQVVSYLLWIPLYVAVEYSESIASAVFFLIASILLAVLYIIGVVNARKWTFEYNYKLFAENISAL